MLKREVYMSRIRPFIDRDIIKVLSGLRRSGKSVMLQLILEELGQRGIPDNRMIIYNFEDLRHKRLLTAEALHEEILREMEAFDGRAYLFLDEIQEVQNWERCVNSLRASTDCDIYITGSNAKLLSGELATHLAGRYVEFVIYPFSFSEFRELYTAKKPGRSDQEIFMDYLDLGGMPYLNELEFDQAASRIYLQDLFNSVVLKDIVSRNQIRDVDLLERIIAYTFAHAGTEFSANSISKFFKSEKRSVAPETIMNYLTYCVDAYLLYRVKKQDVQGKRILAVKEKYYVADHGIREAVYGGNLRDINLVLENVVFMEMVRRGCKITVGRVGDREIDFVAEMRNERIYVQVAYLLAAEETIEREFSAFRDVQDNYPKYVLSLDEINMSREGIRHLHVRDFLQMEDWN